MRLSALMVLLGAALAWIGPATAQEFTPEVATTEVLPDHSDETWFWVSGMRSPNQVDSRAFLFDETGRMRGQLSTGFWFRNLVTADERGELVAVETYFSRGTRGERTDLVTIYDPATLSPIDEIIIPPKRLNAVKNSGGVAISEDERFLLVANYTPAQSVTIVDLDARSFVVEVETPGCSVLYGGGNRDFYSICGNGGFLHIKIDDEGHVVSRIRTPPLFDPVGDFLLISAARMGNVWYFISRDNNVYGIKMDGDTIELINQFSLVSDKERADDWLISGMHNTAAHAASGELYVLMHQGGPDSFEAPGSHVWVYDTATGEKTREIEMNDMTMSIAVSQTETPRLHTLDFHIPFGGFVSFLIYLFEGEEAFGPIVKERANVYDAASGDHILATDLLPDGAVLGIQTWE